MWCSRPSVVQLRIITAADADFLVVPIRHEIAARPAQYDNIGFHKLSQTMSLDKPINNISNNFHQSIKQALIP